jgi:hypothetical protein
MNLNNKLLIAAILFFIILGCKKEIANNNIQKSLQEEKPEIEVNYIKDIDTSSVGILVRKRNKTQEDKILLLKNTAFCLCHNKEEQFVLQNNPTTYNIIGDNTIQAYVQSSDIDPELLIRNKQLNKLVDKWHKKVYRTKPKEEKSDQKSFLINMKCLDFYNSIELNNYLDSIKVTDKL